LPKANYSPLKYKSLSKNYSSMESPTKKLRYPLDRSTNLGNPNSQLQLSLPPIKN